MRNLKNTLFDNSMLSGVMSLDGEAGTGGEGGGGGTGAAAAAGAPWYQGADAELIGHIQTKGWHELSPDKAALEAVRAHREAEKHFGVPADQIIKLPKDASDEAGWNTVYERLGVPSDPTKYDFSGVKFSDGETLQQADQDWLRDTAKELKLTPERAQALAGRLAKYVEGAEGTDSAETTAKLAVERDALAKNWGQNFEANKFLATQGARALGIGPEEVAALEKVAGYAKTMEAMRKVGELSGESRYIANGNPSFNSGVMTREQAVARKSELMADSAWAKRYSEGGAAEAREMKGLLTIITGETDSDYAR